MLPAMRAMLFALQASLVRLVFVGKVIDALALAALELDQVVLTHIIYEV